jgi:6-methylsalicylate decarboxylase
VRIDVHAHWYTMPFMERMWGLGCTWRPTQQILDAAGAMPQRLEHLEAGGGVVQVLSVGAQQPYLADPKAAVEAATFANDAYREVVDAGGGHYRAFGCVPLPHVDAAVTEARRCLDDLGFAGINLGCSVAGRALESTEFLPFWAELDRRDTVVFLHPVGVGGPLMDAFNLAWTIGATFEDTVTAVRLVRSGLVDRFPNVKIIVPHLGGTIPFLWGRLQGSEGRRPREDGTPGSSIAEGLKKLYYDTVNQGAAALHCTCENVGASHVMLGTDYPYQTPEECVRYIEDSGLPADDVSAILEGNARQLLGL